MLSGLFYSPPRRMMIGDPTHDRLATLGGTPLATLGRDPPFGRVIKRCRQTYGCRRLVKATRDSKTRFARICLRRCQSNSRRSSVCQPYRRRHSRRPDGGFAHSRQVGRAARGGGTSPQINEGTAPRWHARCSRAGVLQHTTQHTARPGLAGRSVSAVPRLHLKRNCARTAVREAVPASRIFIQLHATLG